MYYLNYMMSNVYINLLALVNGVNIEKILKLKNKY